jgi:hypothetical protein
MSVYDHQGTGGLRDAPPLQGAAIPHIRTVGLDRPWAWLAAGWRDFSTAPQVSLTYGLALVAISYILVTGLSSIGLFYLVLPLACGFMLIGPLVAVGLYEVSRRIEKGEKPSMGTALRAYSANAAHIGAIGLGLMLFMLFWVRVALLIFALFFSYQPQLSAADAGRLRQCGFLHPRWTDLPGRGLPGRRDHGDGGVRDQRGVDPDDARPRRQHLHRGDDQRCRRYP